MSHDQLAKVFPDGRTVHQSTSGPLKGFEVAKAEIERRGNGEETQGAGKPSFLAALFKGKSASDEDGEGAAPPPVKSEKPIKTTVVARRARQTGGEASQARWCDPAARPPTPRSSPRRRQAGPGRRREVRAEAADPADIINARGFWITPPRSRPPSTRSAPSTPATPSRAADPQPTAGVSEAFKKAMAYAPAAVSPVDRANVVTASAPIPRSTRSAAPSRNSMAVNDLTTVIAKGGQGEGSMIATSARLAASKGSNELWMRVMMLAPSASTSMSVTVFGDADLTLMRQHFVKPQAIVAMAFSDDPTLGLVTDRFTGSSTARLETRSFVLRTAALR